MKRKRRWYWWVGLVGLVLMSGVPLAMVRSFLHLMSGLPRYAISDLLDVPLFWGQMLLVVIPQTLLDNVYEGIGMLIAAVGIPIFCFWLLKKGT